MDSWERSGPRTVSSWSKGKSVLRRKSREASLAGKDEEQMREPDLVASCKALRVLWLLL